MIFISVFIQHIIGKYELKGTTEVTLITRWPQKYDLSVGRFIVKLCMFFSWKATSHERCVFTIHTQIVALIFRKNICIDTSSNYSVFSKLLPIYLTYKHRVFDIVFYLRDAYNTNYRIDGVTNRVLTSSTINRKFESRSGPPG